MGNCLTIVSVFLCTKLRTKTNIFVVNLAFGDLMICLFIPIEVLALLSPGEPPVPDILKTMLAIVLTVSIASTRQIAAVVDEVQAATHDQPPIALEHRNHEPAARQERPNQMADNRFRARQVKVTKNLALVTVVFLLCFLPFPIAANSSNPHLLTFGMFVVWSNSAMNPLIYAAKHADFRKHDIADINSALSVTPNDLFEKEETT
ncbi:uncharacterized protein LOC121412963 [Lytechinus variegatus]|uniref:uncharacterized protein LOC121412963 n=1 Tax=Lytechinus variegatus TaxID=7654 RepID=UPI001BB25E1C|nr:uncharacterized protein LOC121412963 [Lytechinus variegatus]